VILSVAEMWKATFEVIAGPYVGRKVFDQLAFSEAAMRRVKLALSCLGFDVSGTLNITSDQIIGRKCVLSLDVEAYRDANGNRRTRNKVGFTGYSKADSVPAPASGRDELGEVIPF
jgi:hypothetical protein